MNQLDHTGPIPEFGAHTVGRQRRIAMTLIAATCTLAFIYNMFPDVAHILNIIAVALVVMTAPALTITGIVMSHKGGV